MTTYLHTMVRITDPEKSRAFYEALGFEAGRELPIAHDLGQSSLNNAQIVGHLKPALLRGGITEAIQRPGIGR